MNLTNRLGSVLRGVMLHGITVIFIALGLDTALPAQQAALTHTQAVARARSLVAKMTLDEKIAQLHGIRDPQNFRVIPGLPRLGIPAFHMTNGPAGVGPGGAGPQKPATAMPAPIALAATWDPSLAFAYGKLEGEETRSTGSQLFEAPDVNIARVPQGGRVFESFGEDPYLDSRIAVADIEGIQDRVHGAHMIANVKHFIANNQESARMSVDEIIGERALREIYMPQFEAAIKEAHSASLMCAYPKVNGAFNCENEPLLTGVLKKEWGFDGFVVSDWGATHSTVPSALNGLDVEMPTGRYFSDDLKKAVESGQVPQSRIDDMLVRRFAKMMEFGLFGSQPKPAPIPAFEHGAEARKIAAQGMVLLKNADNILPLDPAVRNIALIGPWAVRPSTGGGGSSHVVPLYTITPDDGLRAAMASRISVLDGSDLNAATAAAKRAQIAIVMVGDEDSEGRDQSLTLSQAQDDLITAVAKANPKTIVVLKSGSAILMPWLDSVAAVLEAWYPGEEDGHAVADVLTGAVDPSGKLPLTFPRSVDQTLAAHPEQYPGENGTVHYSEGIEVGYRAYAANNVTPLFPFGFGLSYTTFRFSDLKTSTLSGAANAIVSFKVTNTGKRSGAEVAQLYLGFPPIAEGNEPPIQLKGFRKVMLNPGESKTVELKLDARSFSYWSEKTHGWQIPQGEFQVMVGDSSAETPLKGTIKLQ
ncbi:glycosyl hydrolase [Edaphobacter acidisoli]|uniref:Glycosyl hydrolase n=1 Tax=Edaphobacter acidisoli TaxID=2040573 RepID=A0A916RJZ1_9BACT|nr:glycoside hydrolase family 3 C-terminal domain-containing protein [Edaphobacter acidisoli]GGA56541.1 glycosyl hydrolase [Edaphobacter acidisoli]